MDKSQYINEETLDPTNWEEIRSLGHIMVEDMINYLATVRKRAVWRSTPVEIQKILDEPLPLEGQEVETTYEEFLEYILPYPMGNIHPRFWGWVIGTGTPLGMLAEMLAAGMNSCVGGGDHAANYIEMRVVEWCKRMLDYPNEASGLLVSGCSMANLIGLSVARNTKAEVDVRKDGAISILQPLTLYGSTEMHLSLQRAVEILGLGNRFLRRIPVKDDYKVDLQALERAIKEDLANGRKPICIIGNAGTVNTGAIDPLDELAEIAAKYGLWFHIDGAFGALAALSSNLRHLVKGMERADSLAIDLHKWVYLPYEVGCILIRDEEAHHQSFVLQPAYIQRNHHRKVVEPPCYRDYGIQLSRGFRALKVWMAIKTHGINKLGRLIYQNVCQAQYLAELIEQSKHLELLAPVELNIVCFRFREPGQSIEQLNMINREILRHLRESGTAILSGLTLRKKFALRCAITNHRSVRADFELLVSEVTRIGKILASNVPDVPVIEAHPFLS